MRSFKTEVLQKHAVLIPNSLENSCPSPFKVQTKIFQIENFLPLLFSMSIYKLQFRIEKRLNLGVKTISSVKVEMITCTQEGF